MDCSTMCCHCDDCPFGLLVSFSFVSGKAKYSTYLSASYFSVQILLAFPLFLAKQSVQYNSYIINV